MADVVISITSPTLDAILAVLQQISSTLDRIAAIEEGAATTFRLNMAGVETEPNPHAPVKPGP